jgi:hypothetical protein
MRRADRFRIHTLAVKIPWLSVPLVATWLGFLQNRLFVLGNLPDYPKPFFGVKFRRHFSRILQFDGPTEGYDTSMMQGTDGAFYGVSFSGGQYNYGTISRIDLGLAPFVLPVLTFGHVGDHVSLLGSNMTGVSAVSFNGTPATIISSCETHIATAVPERATSGPITLTTSTGTLTSNVAFTVLP